MDTSMKFAIFLGCTIPARLNEYEASARAVLKKLNIELVDIDDFNCCGYPLRNFDFKSYLLSSVRNLALAQKKNLKIITLCQCCYGSLKRADYIMKEDPSLKDTMNGFLKKEKLEYKGGIEIKHILSVLHDDYGIEALKEKIIQPLKEIKIAAHYGCHALRPSRIVQLDDPADPKIFDRLVEITGSKSVYWSGRLECCGAPLWGIHDDLSVDIMRRKLKNSRDSGAEYICTACPYCQIQFDSVQSMIMKQENGGSHIPAILYTQLLGLSMGIDEKVLMLDRNIMPIGEIKASVPSQSELHKTNV
jgi:heterodisulfide reductase subunit B